MVLGFLGGGLGSVCRFWLSHWVNAHLRWAKLPWGTLTVNVIGCWLIGLVLAYLEKQAHPRQEWALLLTTGFCGGFTTFSAFAFEQQILLRQGFGFGLYVGLSLILGLGAVYAGIWLGQKV
ncbi:MAG: fluoride efflux transporter CrcB [Microscillaceae bacterium]|nr:fluoride efflux transporter CrcB [Microscillaceae bacterium]